MNRTIADEGEEYTTHQHTTPSVEVPNYLLDEWANAFQFDPMQEAKGIGIGTKNSPIPNLVKEQENTSGLWDMFFDG